MYMLHPPRSSSKARKTWFEGTLKWRVNAARRRSKHGSWWLVSFGGDEEDTYPLTPENHLHWKLLDATPPTSPKPLAVAAPKKKKEEAPVHAGAGGAGEGGGGGGLAFAAPKKKKKKAPVVNAGAGGARVGEVDLNGDKLSKKSLQLLEYLDQDAGEGGGGGKKRAREGSGSSSARSGGRRKSTVQDLLDAATPDPAGSNTAGARFGETEDFGFVIYESATA